MVRYISVETWTVVGRLKVNDTFFDSSEGISLDDKMVTESITFSIPVDWSIITKSQSIRLIFYSIIPPLIKKYPLMFSPGLYVSLGKIRLVRAEPIPKRDMDFLSNNE